jgi:hypothetical protein
MMVYNRELLDFWTCPSSSIQMAQCIYSIPCEYGERNIGETGRSLAMQLREHRHNLKKGLLVKSKLVQHAYEESHRVGWDDVRILETESNSKFKKYIHCMLNQSYQPTQFGHFLHLDPPYQQ